MEEFTLLIRPGVVDWDCAALDLIAPASKVSPGSDTHPNVGFEGKGVHSARVDALDGGELLLMLLHKVRQPCKQSSSIPGINLTPFTILILTE